MAGCRGKQEAAPDTVLTQSVFTLSRLKSNAAQRFAGFSPSARTFPAQVAAVPPD
jgi:hypothetical protein